MKVAFNISSLYSEHKGRGIGSYTANLLAKLKELPDLKIQEFIKSGEVKDADIVHYPQFDLFNFTLPLFKKFPTVVTIHDVTPLLFPDYYPPGLKGQAKGLMQKLSLKSVAGIITDSQSSKTDIARILKVPHQKVFTSSLASSAKFRPIKDLDELEKVRRRYHLPEKFVLYIGNVNWNKNIVNMTQACVDLNVDLVLLGKSFEQKDNLDHPELKSYREFLKKFKRHPNIHILGYVEGDDLVKILNQAKATLLVSYYEGFGLPILESQACGVPVVTSNTSSMPEVAGDSTYLIDPYSPESIKEGIKMVLEDKSLAEKLVKKGFENIKRFSWEKTAQETARIYEEILKNG